MSIEGPLFSNSLLPDCCMLNSIFQILLHLPDFRNAIKDANIKRDRNDLKNYLLELSKKFERKESSLLSLDQVYDAFSEASIDLNSPSAIFDYLFNLFKVY